MFAKVVIFCASLAAVQASVLLHAPVVSTGVSSTVRKDDGHGNYAFGYDIVDGKGAANSRSEMGDAHGNKVGSYSLHDTDGRARRVDYVADSHGFRATVKTNEPGTAASAPAAALIASPYAAPASPIDVNHAMVGASLIAPAAINSGIVSLGLGHAPVSAYSSVIGHGAALAHAPITAYSNVLGHGASLAPISAYSNVIGHGAYLGSPALLGLSPIGKSLIL